MGYGFDRVSFGFGKKLLISDLSWRLPEKGILCLWGASGSGKTTVLRLLAGLALPQEGKVVRPEKPRPVAVFQENRLLPWFSLLENVCLPPETDRKKAEELLKAVGLEEQMHRLPAEVSGGEQRRSAICRALGCPGDILLLDEPFTGLDDGAKATVFPLIRAFAEQVPVVLITHDEEDARSLADRIITLDRRPLTGEW